MMPSPDVVRIRRTARVLADQIALGRQAVKGIASGSLSPSLTSGRPSACPCSWFPSRPPARRSFPRAPCCPEPEPVRVPDGEPEPVQDAEPVQHAELGPVPDAGPERAPERERE